MRTRTKPIIFASLTLLIGLCVSLGATELFLRLYGFSFLFSPPEIQFGWPDPVTIKGVFQADRDLFWVTRDYYPKVASWRGKHPAVAFMGCSCTQLSSYDKHLMDLVAAYSNRPAPKFVNLGVAGWSTYQGALQLERDVVPMKPRFITVYYGWNDHWISLGIQDKDIGKLHIKGMRALDRLRVAQLLNQTIVNLKSRISNEKRHPERVSLDDFRANLVEIVRTARADDIEPILLTAPTSHQKGKEPPYLAGRWLDDLNDLVPLHQRYAGAVRDVAAREKVLLADLARETGNRPHEQIAPWFWPDGIHLTEPGSQAVAGMLFDFFKDNKLIERLTRE
ncbi:MAG: GDSL-type esterase/lipase family protein [Deltaproteobacteria bacterium]|nr:GDSL-type esterase/lipase family protein [Deltaproteobacteria bacterium]